MIKTMEGKKLREILEMLHIDNSNTSSFVVSEVWADDDNKFVKGRYRTTSAKDLYMNNDIWLDMIVTDINVTTLEKTRNIAVKFNIIHKIEKSV